MSVPPTNSLGTQGHGSAQLGDKLVGISSDFNDVVHEGKEWGKREGSNKDGYETKLKYCKQIQVQNMNYSSRTSIKCKVNIIFKLPG